MTKSSVHPSTVRKLKRRISPEERRMQKVERRLDDIDKRLKKIQEKCKNYDRFIVRYKMIS